MTTITRNYIEEWETVIGLEVHAQIASNSKLFSSSKANFGAEPNSDVSFFDAAMPGTLPVLNFHCVEQTIKTGLAVDAKIGKYSVFARKNYFYPDLPHGYQISQLHHPIVLGGEINILDAQGENKRISLNRIHIEMDAGKSIHDQSPDKTYIDLNRAGCPLMEIVTEPEIASAAEAGAYMRKLRTILQYVGSCEANMEKGELRCDANISVRRKGEKVLGNRCEVKNLNSIRHIMLAIEYETKRQITILENNGEVKQETRLFDPSTGETKLLRTKEEAADYRYFPDPDLLPLVIPKELISSLKKILPELPDAKRERYINKLGLSPYEAEIIILDKEVVGYFEKVITVHDPSFSAKWIITELFGRLNKQGINIIDSPITAEDLIELFNLIKDNTISGKIAKQVFEEMFVTSKGAAEIVKSMGITQITDNNALEEVINKVLSLNPDKVIDYKAGKTKLLGFFVGQVMKETNGRANPQIVNDILLSKLLS